MSELDVKYFRNANENESLFVPAGIDAERIPLPFCSLIDDRYQSFLDDPPSAIKSLAAQTRFEPLRVWLDELGRSIRFGLIVHYAEFFGNIQHDLTVCCIASTRQRFFRLPDRRYPADRLQFPLNDFYRVTDGIIESRDAFLTSQFVTFPNLFFDFESSFPIRNAPVSNLAEILALYRSDTGDYLVVDKDSAFAFCHDDCSFHDRGTITELLESYFRSDLGNTSWNPFPYA